MTGFITVVEQRQRSATVDEVQRRGEVLARSLAATSTGALLLYNFTALEQNVGQVAGESDVVYAIILDGDGKVVAHSRRPELVGSVLEGAVNERAAGTSQLLVQEAAQRKTGEPIYDIAMPVYVEGQKWGVARIGLSRRRMEAQIRRTRWELAALSRRDPRGRRSGSRVRRAAHRASRSAARGGRRGDLAGRARPADRARRTRTRSASLPSPSTTWRLSFATIRPRSTPPTPSFAIGSSNWPSTRTTPTASWAPSAAASSRSISMAAWPR